MSYSYGSSEKRGFEERRRAERRTSPELAAYHWTGTFPKQEIVRDISATGVYLLTTERWTPGDTVSLTLQRKGPLEGNFERRVAIQARAVRWGDDGIALSFILPEGMDLRLWESPLKSASEQTNPEDVLKEFRIAAVLAFVQRISPAAIDEVRRLFREGLSNYRAASAIEIALRADRLLAFGPNYEKMRSPAPLVLRILEQGSWADAESAQQLWAGLLATSCSLSGRDDANLTFVDLLSQLTATHVRLLVAACTKAAKFMSSVERLSSRPVTLSGTGYDADHRFARPDSRSQGSRASGRSWFANNDCPVVVVFSHRRDRYFADQPRASTLCSLQRPSRSGPGFLRGSGQHNARSTLPTPAVVGNPSGPREI